MEGITVPSRMVVMDIRFKDGGSKEIESIVFRHERCALRMGTVFRFYRKQKRKILHRFKTNKPEYLDITFLSGRIEFRSNRENFKVLSLQILHGRRKYTEIVYADGVEDDYLVSTGILEIIEKHIPGFISMENPNVSQKALLDTLLRKSGYVNYQK